MDKHEYKHLVDEIQYLIDQQEYAKAAEIADTIDWRRVRSVMTLGTISDLYRINKRYEDARDIMLMAYDRKPENSQVCYSLCELFIKTGEMADAVEFYKEYERLTSQDDPNRYILQYKMYEANNVSLEEKAEVLENLRQREYQEKWLYELAYLYHRMELETKCVEICDELILWFGSGEYVNKALELKRLHAPLTPEQQAKYDSRFEPEAPAEDEAEIAPEEDEPEEQVWEGTQDTGEFFEQSEEKKLTEDATRMFDVDEVRRQAVEYASADGDTAPMVKIMDVGQYNTLNLQAEIAAGVNEVLSGADNITRTLLRPMIDPETGYYDIGSTTEIMDSLSRDAEYMENSEVYFGETGEVQYTGRIQGTQDAVEDEYGGTEYAGEDLLKAEYAGEELYAETAPVEGQTAEEYVLGNQITEEDSAENYAAGEYGGTEYAGEDDCGEEPAEDAAAENLEAEEAFAENREWNSDGENSPDQGVEPFAPAEGQGGDMYEDNYVGYVEESSAGETDYEEISIADRVMEQMRFESLEAQKKLENEVLTAQPPEPMARALAQEPDGQIRLVVPEGRKLEKQITGQLSIEDIRAEWERMKQESREKQEEEVRQRVQRQTGRMFTEFEEALRDNILKQMERKEDPSLYEEPEVLEESEGKAAGTEEDGDWSMDEWMPEGGETWDASEEMSSEGYGDGRETEGEYIEAEEASEGAEKTYEAQEESEEYEEGISFGEYGNGQETEGEYIEAEEVSEGAEEILEEAGEALEEFEEIPEEADEALEEFEEIPEEADETLEEFEELPEEADEALKEFEELPEEAEEILEEVETALTEDSWGDDEYPDFVEEETASEPADEEETVEKGPAEEAEEALKEPEEAGESLDEAEEKDSDKMTEKKDGEEVSEEKPDSDEDASDSPKEKGSPAEQTSDAPAVRFLTEEEENLFGELVQGRSAREQLVKAIDSISMAAYAGNLVITGEESSLALEMAKNMVRELKQTDSNFSGKAARISGKKMNGKKVSEFLEQLKNGALIVDNASRLSEETLTDLYKCMQQDSYGLLVILTDTKKKMNLFLKEHKKFASMFNARVDLQPLSNEVLAEYAQQYAREREFSIDDLGMLALHTRIDEMQTAKHSVTKAEIGEIMDAAIDSASKKNVGHFFDILFGKRYDDEDMIIITEKDFE